jgi:deoxyribonuclease-4
MGELLIGAHMSISGGHYRALKQGEKLGCRTIQIFLKNRNRWEGTTISEEDCRKFRDEQERSRIRPVVAHDSYLINLASPDPDLYQKSIHAFTDEMTRAHLLGIPYLILHPGSHVGSGAIEGMARITAALNRALNTVPPPPDILLENTAGQGSSIGHCFEQLAVLLEGIEESDRIGFCLDTCHLFAAGYDIRTRAGYEQTMRKFHRLIGTERIRTFHVNDCLRELGSRVDRHTHIGKGFIGLEAFRCLLRDRRFAGVPKILETPKGKDLKQDRMNLATLRSLAK